MNYDFIYGYFLKNKIIIILYTIVILFIYPIQHIVLPYWYSSLYEKIENHKFSINIPKSIFNNIFSNLLNRTLSGIILIIIFLWIIIYIFENIKNRIEEIIIPYYVEYNRYLLLSNLLKNKSTNYKQIKVAKNITQIMSITRVMKNLLIEILENLPTIITILIIIIYFFYINKYLGISFLFGNIIFLLCGLYFFKKILKESINTFNKYIKICANYEDTLSNLLNIYINNQTQQEIKKNYKVVNKFASSSKNQSTLSKEFINYSTIISILIFISMFVISYYLNKEKLIKSKLFYTIILIMGFYVGITGKIITSTPDIIYKLGYIEGSKKFIDNILVEDIKLYNTTFLDGTIEFKSVYFKYPSTYNFILENINFKIFKGQHICFTGTSGSGKSTLVKLLLKIFHINHGQILLNNINIKNINTYSLRKNIIYVNQITNLFNTSIINNILYGNKKYKKHLLHILDKYKLSTIFSNINGGIFANVGVNGTKLSLGMQKIIIILRGILRSYHASIIIFDEPLSSLDFYTKIKVIRLIKQECKNKTVIIITHDKEIFPYCNKILDISSL